MQEKIDVLLQSASEEKQNFMVHFVAHQSFDLDLFLRQLGGIHPLVVLRGRGSLFQTIEIEIKPSILRRLQETLPRSVLVAYERKHI